jgi:hypothetical protein
VQEGFEIAPCETPLERLGDGLVVELEGQQPCLEGWRGSACGRR